MKNAITRHTATFALMLCGLPNSSYADRDTIKRFQASNGLAVAPNLDHGNLFTVGDAKFATDRTALGNSWIVNRLGKVGSTDDGSATESTFFFSALVPATESPSNYEKNAGCFRCQTSDPSTTGRRAVTRDCVGAAMAGEILPGNRSGRAWGGTSYAIADKLSEGFLGGFESDLINDTGVDASEMNKPSTKVGFQAVAYGSNKSTSAYVVSSAAPARWANGIFFYSRAIANYYLTDDAGRVFLAKNGRYGVGTPPLYPDVFVSKQNLGSARIRLETGDESNLEMEFARTGAFAWEFGLRGSDDSFVLALGASGLDRHRAFEVDKFGAPSFPMLPDVPASGRHGLYVCVDASGKLFKGLSCQ